MENLLFNYFFELAKMRENIVFVVVLLTIKFANPSLIVIQLK